jgi:hydroxymethylbilane synthase
MKDRILNIGTRGSQLAMWQATHVQTLLAQQAAVTTLVPVKSEGDLDLKTPLYEMGVQGIFTRTLDTALLNNQIDIAVHSMKDVPTRLPEGIVQAAVLPRASYLDVLVQRDPVSLDELISVPATIATSSTRRRAQWLRRFPHHRIESLRGNVNSRLQKLAESHWQGAIFAAAGLDRINLLPGNAILLDWMLPAPAQGAIVIVCREDDPVTWSVCKSLNDAGAELCTRIEKDFLRILLGGCTAPIGAIAELKDGHLFFRGNLLSPDGSELLEIEKSVALKDADNLGIISAEDILQQGGRRLVDRFSKTAS